MGVQRDRAVLELVEGCVVVFVDAQKLLLKALQLILVRWVLADQLRQLVLQLREVGRAPVDVLLSLKQKDLLLFVVGFDLLCQRVLAILEHLDEHLQLLLQLRQRALLFGLQSDAKRLIKELGAVKSDLRGVGLQSQRVLPRKCRFPRGSRRSFS